MPTLIGMEETLEERLERAENKADRAMAEVTMLKAFVNDVDRRLLAQEKLTEKFLDSTKEIKDLLTDNTRDTHSARNNAKGWGITGVIISVVFKIGEIIFRSKVAL